MMMMTKKDALKKVINNSVIRRSSLLEKINQEILNKSQRGFLCTEAKISPFDINFITENLKQREFDYESSGRTEEGETILRISWGKDVEKYCQV